MYYNNTIYRHNNQSTMVAITVMEKLASVNTQNIIILCYWYNTTWKKLSTHTAKIIRLTNYIVFCTV